MVSLIIGTPERVALLRQSGHPVLGLNPDFCTDGEAFSEALPHYDFILHLNLDERPEHIALYFGLEGKILLVSAVKRSLAEMVYDFGHESTSRLFGLNALPTFLDRSQWEVSAWDAERRPELEQTLTPLGLTFRWVADEVGMVSARVLSLILNEAYLMRDEGTATPEDIDNAMRLGTNYPHGPFEWASRIGPRELLEVLTALQRGPGMGRIPIARSLRQEAASIRIGVTNGQ